MTSARIMDTHRPFTVGEMCPACSKGRLSLQNSPFEFEYKGQKKLFSLERLVCDTCEEDFVDDQASGAVEPALRRWRRDVDGLLQT